LTSETEWYDDTAVSFAVWGGEVAGLGIAVACGDVDGDGYDDLVTGASTTDMDYAGAVYVIYGPSTISNPAIDLNEPAGTYGETRITNYDPFNIDSFGAAVAAGDLDGDAYADVIVGAPRTDSGAGYGHPENVGARYTVYGTPALASTSVSLHDPLPPAWLRVDTILGAQPECFVGGVLGAGDVNGDGLADPLGGVPLCDVGDPARVDAGAASAGTAAGAVHVGMAGAAEGDHLGAAVAGRGDIDFDGFADFLAAAPGVAGAAGAAYLVYGRGDAAQASVQHHDRADDAPPRDFGPTVRCKIDYSTGSASETTVTVVRSNAGLSLAHAAHVCWYISTDRTNAWPATITFRYTDREVAERVETVLSVWQADTPSGPFTPLTTTLDTAHNSATVEANGPGVFALAEMCGCPPQDWDWDADVDGMDFLAFQSCYNGPNRPYNPGAVRCECFDADHDADVDGMDFLVFQGCYNGPNRPPACGTSGCGGTLLGTQVAGGSDVVFDLRSPIDGKTIGRGTPVAWRVDAAVRGAGAGIAGYAFDLELRSDNETGALAKVTIAPPEALSPLSDESAVWRMRGPDAQTPGRLVGVTDAIAVPWLARFTDFLAAMPSAGAGADDTSNTGAVTVTGGSIDTSALPAGRYVLLLRPTGAAVLRSDAALSTDLVGNFARPARAKSGKTGITFEIAK
jgi:hypothetical protein